MISRDKWSHLARSWIIILQSDPKKEEKITNRKNSKRKNKRKKIEIEAINIISSYVENETALFKMSCEEYCEDDYYDNTDDADFVSI